MDCQPPPQGTKHEAKHNGQGNHDCRSCTQQVVCIAGIRLGFMSRARFLCQKLWQGLPHNIPCQIMSWQLFNPYSYRNSFHELNLASAPGNAGRKGVSKFPPSPSGLHRKAMRYFPKAAVKPGRNTLTPSTRDNFGPLKRASAVTRIRGKMLENI